ncbi:MAG: carboxypeptidase-like regulatory domain-containing protein [Arenibacter algicola]|nr:carboxypeptidase-like regulatory domain-containing protein [Arenibacter algicola]
MAAGTNSIFGVPISELDKDQQLTITGTVTSSEDGMPIPAVNVILKGTNTGTTSDFDGNYAINVLSLIQI